MNSDKVVITSLIFNGLLIVALVLFVIFGRTKPIPKYEAEIATLTTINIGLTDENDELANAKEEYDDDIILFNENLTKVSKKLVDSQAEIERLNRVRNEIPNTVNELPDVAIAGEFSGYLIRRAERKAGE